MKLCEAVYSVGGVILHCLEEFGHGMYPGDDDVEIIHTDIEHRLHWMGARNGYKPYPRVTQHDVPATPAKYDEILD